MTKAFVTIQAEVSFDQLAALFDRAQVSVTTVAPAEPTASADTAAPCGHTVELSPISKLLELLNDPRYQLRTITSLSEKLGVNNDGVFALLEDNDVDYVTKTRRSDGETLIGLASRN